MGGSVGGRSCVVAVSVSCRIVCRNDRMGMLVTKEAVLLVSWKGLVCMYVHLLFVVDQRYRSRCLNLELVQGLRCSVLPWWFMEITANKSKHDSCGSQ